MQIDAETAAILGALSGIGTSIASHLINSGAMKEKVRRVEADLQETKTSLQREQERFVTHQYLDAVVVPLQKTLDSVQTDIKTLLGYLRK